MKRITTVLFLIITMNVFSQITQNFVLGSFEVEKEYNNIDLCVVIGANGCEFKRFMGWCVDYNSGWLKAMPDLEKLIIDYRKNFILKDLDTPKNRIKFILNAKKIDSVFSMKMIRVLDSLQINQK